MKKRLKSILVLGSLIFMLAMSACEDSGPVCPDGMVPCDVNGDTICVPERIGC